MQKQTLQILMIFSMIAWGSTWVSAKILGAYLGSNELVFWRFLFSAVGVLPILLLLNLNLKINFKSALLIIGTSILLTLYNQVFFLGTKFGEANFGGVLVTTLIPIITFVLLALFTKKQTTKKDLLAIGLGSFGAFIMLDFINIDVKDLLADHIKYFLLAAILWPLVTISSSYIKETSAIVTSFYTFILTSILTLFTIDFSVSPILEFDGVFWFNMLLISIVGTSFATSVYFLSSVKVGSKETSFYMFLVPLSAAIFSAIFLGESIKATTILGGCITLIAVYIINGYSLKDLYNKSHGKFIFYK